MADRKISQFTPMPAAVADSSDALPIVDVSAGDTPEANRLITLGTIQTLLGGTNASIENAIRAEEAADDADAARIAAEVAEQGAKDARDAAIASPIWNYRPQNNTQLMAITGMVAGNRAIVIDTMHQWTYSGSAWVDNGPTLLAIPDYVMLTAAGGTGAAYTATAPAAADTNRGVFIFTPPTDQTAINPTLVVNGGPARQIRGIGEGASNTPIGRLKAGVPVVLIPRSTNQWQIVSDWDGINSANVAVLTSLGGAAGAWTATCSAPLVGTGSILKFSPPMDHAGGPLTISLNGGTAIRIYTEISEDPIAGQLRFGGRYMAEYSAGGIRLIGVRLPPVREAQRVTQEAQSAALALSQAVSALDGASNEKPPIYVQGGAGFSHWVASVKDAEDHLIIAAGTPRYIDCRMFREGRKKPLEIYVSGGTTKIIADKIYTAPAGCLVAIRRPLADSWVINSVGGDVTEEADALDAAPACDITFMTAGQSHSVLLIAGSGMHGLQRGLRDHASWMPSIFPVQGASGSTGLVPVSGVAGGAYWWNPATNTPGPSALAWKAALDAIPANQPKPAAISWIFSQNDAGKMGTDPTLSLAAYKATHKALFAWMRAQTGENTPIIWFPLQAYDLDASPTNAQVSAIRWTMFEIAAEDPYTHVGPIYHDLWHPYMDQHPSTAAQAMMGYRLGATLARILNGATVVEGPRVTAITEEAGGASFLITMAGAAGNPIQFPYTPPDTLELDGFEVYAAGAKPMTDSPVTIRRITWVSSTQMRITLSEPSPGAQIMWPAGCIKEHRAGRVIRLTNNVPVNAGWGNHPPLMPFKSSAF